MESDAEAETVREVYERAIANVPPIQEKRHWKRYIYLWVNYALYEELEAKVKNGIPHQLLMAVSALRVQLGHSSATMGGNWYVQSQKQEFSFRFSAIQLRILPVTF